MPDKADKPTIKSHRDFVRSAGRHFLEARARVLKSGQSVLYSREGVIYRLHADGRTEVVKRIAPPIPVKPGTKLRIR